VLILSVLVSVLLNGFICNQYSLDFDLIESSTMGKESFGQKSLLSAGLLLKRGVLNE